MKRLLAFLLSVLCLPLWGATGDIGGVDITPDGLFVRVWFEGYGTNTANMGIATNGTVTSTNFITLSIKSPGFDESLTTNNLNWSQVATFQQRRDYPNQTTKWVDIIGSYAVAKFALERTIHQPDWGITAIVRSGMYSNNAAYSGPVTNGSVIPSPRVMVAWRTIPYNKSTSSQSLTLQAWHASAMSGKPVRAVQFWAQDSLGNYTTTNTVTSTGTNEYWNTTLDYTPLTQGSTVSNHFKAIPWWGTPLSSADNLKLPDWDYGPLISYCNKSGLWRDSIAVVDPVNGTYAGGVATTNWATATNGTLAPFQTIAQALNAAGATNNTYNGSNNYSSCYILLTNGAYTWLGGETPAARTTGITTWTHIMPYPGVNWTNVEIYSNTVSQPSRKYIKLHFKNVYFSWSNNVALVNDGNGHIWFDGIMQGTNTGGSAKLFDFQTNVWAENCIVLYQRNNVWVNLAGSANSAVRLFDNTFYQFISGSTVSMAPVTAIGNRFLPATTSQQQYLFNNNFASQTPIDPFVWTFNQMYRQDNTVYANDIRSTNLTVGGVIAGNLTEGVRVNNGIALDVAYSQRNTDNYTNLLVWHNTILGITHPPFDYGYTNVTRVDQQYANNFFADYEYQGDVRNTSASATNTWCILYSVDVSGNSYYNINATDFMPELVELGFNGLWSSCASNQISTAGFVANQSYSSASTNGLGTYTFNSSAWPVLQNGTYNRRFVMRWKLNGQSSGAFDPPGAYSSASPRKGDFIGL